jgi:G patch domain/KOW motif-containing protein
VKQKYLETALPKIGGYVMILSGRNKFQYGKLLERNSKACTGVVQLSESMNLVSIPLDDIAEWCGPLNEDNI